MLAPSLERRLHESRDFVRALSPGLKKCATHSRSLIYVEWIHEFSPLKDYNACCVCVCVSHMYVRMEWLCTQAKLGLVSISLSNFVIFYYVILKQIITYLRWMTWCFDIHIHREMIPPVTLINMFLSSCSYHLCVWREHRKSMLLAIL